jgi:acyl-ACP thioesterase
MKIYKEKAGVISQKEVWCCIHNEYLYIANTLKELIKILNTEWENDKHLIG